MAKAYYLPADDEGKDTLLTNIAGKLATYKTTLGLEDAVVTNTQADAAFFHYARLSAQSVANFAQQWTAYKNAARNGTDPSLGPAPVMPTLGTAPAAVPPGIFKRLTALVTRIKAHPGYTNAIGQDLDIVGAEQTLDTANAKPVLKLELAAGHPNVKWTKGGFDAQEIWVDRGSGFVFLAIDTIPDYLDTAALPAAGASALWKYKSIYRLNDTQVGQWSDVVSIAVTG